MKTRLCNFKTILLLVPAMLSLVCPAEALRPLSTDRPDTTESTHTVDARHFQFEMEFAAWTRDGNYRDLSLGQVNFKIGLDDSTDFQVVTPFFTQIRQGDQGFGDLQIRLKRNLWGNDEGSTSMAVMPFIQLPTSSGDLGSDEVEGGVIFPFAFSGPADWSCAVMGEVDLETDDDRDYNLVGLVSATASHEVTARTAVFIELVSVLSAESGSDLEAYFNTGMTWLVTPTWQFDGGIRIGLTAASADYSPFIGMSKKF
jgi:hypothetical protein